MVEEWGEGELGSPANQTAPAQNSVPTKNKSAPVPVAGAHTNTEIHTNNC